MNSKKHPTKSNIYTQLWSHIDNRRKLQLVLLGLLLVIAVVAEIISIGSILPLLGVFLNPESIYSNKNLFLLINILDLTDSKSFLLIFTLVFVLAALFSGIVRLSLLWSQIMIGNLIGLDFSSKIYRNALYRPYLYHVSSNSSLLIASISTKASAVVGNTIIPILLVISSLIIVTGVMAILLLINFEITIFAVLLFLGIYLGLIFFTKSALRTSGKVIDVEQSQVIKSLQEGLGGIRDVIIDGSQELFYNVFRNSDMPLRKATTKVQFIASCPRYMIEALSIVSISIFGYLLLDSEGVENKTVALSTLAVLALAAQRLLPLMQQIYNNISYINAGKDSVIELLPLLEPPNTLEILASNTSIPSLKRTICLDSVTFQYPGTNSSVLKDFSFKFYKGDRVGVIGSSGCGKSTLLDILMGLLEPNKGRIYIDDVELTPFNRRSWQKQIAHVPQNIFLSDATIAENIAFGVMPRDINNDRLYLAAKRAQLHELINSWQDGYQTKIGERGIRISGGQRQRIGIARALYKNVEVLVLDEATSALDEETEALITSEFDQIQDITIIVVAHRLNTLRNCSQIISLKNGIIDEVGSYDEMINSSK